MATVSTLDLLTQAESAELIRVSRVRVCHLVAAGRIPTLTIGRRKFILRADAEHYKTTRRKPGRPPSTSPTKRREK